MLAVFFFVKKLLYGLNPPGYASIIVSIFFLAGIQLITLGVIGEYVGRIFEEAKRRPMYVLRRANRSSLMRILMLDNEFPPLGGGMGTVNQALLQFVRVPGLEIDLITSALGKTSEEESFSDKIKLYKVPVRNKNIHHSANRELIEYAIRSLRLALKLHRKNPYDLCFAWSAVPAGAVALALRRIIGLRYILRVCGPDIPGFEQRYQMIHFLIVAFDSSNLACGGQVNCKIRAAKSR